jgi:hypothetical protein
MAPQYLSSPQAIPHFCPFPFAFCLLPFTFCLLPFAFFQNEPNSPTPPIYNIQFPIYNRKNEPKKLLTLPILKRKISHCLKIAIVCAVMQAKSGGLLSIILIVATILKGRVS